MPKLTKTYVSALEPKEADYFAWDSEVPFGVRVFKSGRKSFVIQYRSGGRTRRVTIGKVGVLTVEDARKEARALLGDVSRGDNPAETRRRERATPTMKTVCERFWKEHVQARGKPTTQREYRRLLDKIIIPRLGNHRITDLSRPDIAKLHHELRNHPYQANRTLAVLSKLFNLCEVWGLRPDGSNPCRHVRKFKEEKRECYLTGEELQRLGAVLKAIEEEEGPTYRKRDKALGAEWPLLTFGVEDTATPETLPRIPPEPYPVPYVSCIRLLILTGCRLGEIQTLRWEYVKGDVIELPDSKTGAKRIYLGKAAIEELARIPRPPGNPYVITGNVEGAPFYDMNKPWRRIRERAGLDDNIRLHDLRHSFASGAVGMGESLPMIGKLLGHSQVQTTARYAHLADDPVRLSAERISAELAKALG